MNTLVTSALNKRARNDNVAFWQYDNPTRRWQVVYSPMATGRVPPPDRSFGLLASAHAVQLSKSDELAGANDSVALMATVIGEVLSTLNNEMSAELKLVANRFSQTPTYIEKLGRLWPDTVALRNLCRQAAENAPSGPHAELVQGALASWANGTTLSPEALRRLHRPLMRLAHTDVTIDPDNVPRYERDLHHDDFDGQLVELRTVLELTFEALTADPNLGALAWQKVCANTTAAAHGYANADVNSVFAQMASSTQPFGLASEHSMEYADLVYEAIKKENQGESLVLVAAPSAPVDTEHVIHMANNREAYAIGTASMPFVEAMLLAAKALRHSAEPATEDRDMPAVEYERRAVADVVVQRTADDVVKFLAQNFKGWHHSRCLEPRQTAHVRLGKRMSNVLQAWLGNDVNDKVYQKMLKDLAHLERPMLSRLAGVGVLGPGNGAVVTTCKVQGCYVATPDLATLSAVVWQELHQSLKDCLRPLKAGSVAMAFEKQPAMHTKPLQELLKWAEPVLVVLVVGTCHTLTGVRTEGGRRYRHQLGVQAAAVAFHNALHQLLLSKTVGTESISERRPRTNTEQ